MTQQDKEVQVTPKRYVCQACFGTGWVVRDPDIGTDQECFVCDGTREVDWGEPEDEIK